MLSHLLLLLLLVSLILHAEVGCALPIVTRVERIGDGSLTLVRRLAGGVASAPKQQKSKRSRLRPAFKKMKKKLAGGGGTVFDSDAPSSSSSSSSPSPNTIILQPDKDKSSKENQVWEALSNLESGSKCIFIYKRLVSFESYGVSQRLSFSLFAQVQLLDVIAGEKPQLSALEFSLLATAVVSAASGPLLPLGNSLTEFLAPSAAAFCAAIGIGAEYVGKIAVADGKEVAAQTIICAAEAEAFLASAERSKAITPLCVGVATLAASFALLVPVLLDSLGGLAGNLQLITEVYLCCPVVAVLAAAVASLALQETRSYANRAIGIGNRRFARSGLVGRTWLSSTEQIERKSQSTASKWRSFSLSVLPAPLLGATIPGPLPTKTIVVAALAAAQSAFFTAQAEYVLSRATDAVALKARSAAVVDSYANQGARAAAILPFTSALSGLCAAATAAIVELPLVEKLATAGTASATILQVITVSAFPAFSALFAAAASVSKARCEVDAQASMLAASTLALPYDKEEEDPILRPIKGVKELIKLTYENSIREPFRRWFQRSNLVSRFKNMGNWFRRRVWRRTKDGESGGADPAPL